MSKKSVSEAAVKRPWCMITDMDQYLFGEGTHYEIYKKLGAHPTEYNGEQGVYFAVWAPHAKGVRVVGEFNCWGSDGYPMKRLDPLGIYEVFIPGLREGSMYKYLIETESGDYLYKADPFASYAEKRPGTASRVADISHFTWHDERWMEKRKTWNSAEEALSIYEVHPGSWKRHPHEEDEDGFYNYRELAEELTAYVKDMGYTHAFMGTVEAYPDLNVLIRQVSRVNPRRVHLAPFMLVAGDHANNDMAGDDEDSWKSRFEAAGYEVICHIRGLGEYESIRNIYLEHLQEAISS